MHTFTGGRFNFIFILQDTATNSHTGESLLSKSNLHNEGLGLYFFVTFTYSEDYNSLPSGQKVKYLIKI